jgi:hypothetical protein
MEREMFGAGVTHDVRCGVASNPSSLRTRPASSTATAAIEQTLPAWSQKVAGFALDHARKEKT